MKLPIEDVLADVRERLAREPGLVLVAPPGAGKTTRVPLALLDAAWLDGARMVMLEPRRLAARAAARYMARLLGEDVGERVGYRTRLDTRVGPGTRIEVVTEGVLTRMLQSDPGLDGTGLVIFDEFHERSLHADLGLALCLHARELLRPDLRVLVMSATLDAEPVAGLLGDATVLRSEGRAHPVETRHLAEPRRGRIEPHVARAVHRAIEDDQGDVLVFLPGMAEIRRVAELLEGRARSDVAAAGSGPRLPRGVDLYPLHGDLPRDRQDRAIESSPAGRRKVVLATSIAETSLTIDGVRVVIDAGLMRVPRFSPRTGMTRLETVAVTRDAADQRRGRAGRTAPGVCYRLWTEAEEHGLVEHRSPEIREADLAPLALELAAWGIDDPAELRWLDLPAPAAFAQARELLAGLGALDSAGAITGHGRKLATLPAHPRIAHMVGSAHGTGALATACDLAALLGERDPLRSDAPVDPDLGLRVELVEWARAGRAPGTLADSTVDRAALSLVLAESRQWRRRLGVRDGEPADPSVTGLLLAYAFPDRIGRRRGGRGRFLLRNGRGAAIDAHHAIAGEAYIVAAELAGHGRESAVWRAAALSEADLLEHFADQITIDRDVAWDAKSGSVLARRVERLGAIELRESSLPDADPDAVAAALLGGIRAAGVGALPWPDGARNVRDRVAFLRTVEPDAWPDPGDDALAASLEEWLLPWLAGFSSIAALGRLDWVGVLRAWLGHERARRLDLAAPTHIEVPTGSRIAIDYSDPAAPALAVRLQEVFGLRETPRVADGRVPLTLRLLSPARRPVQVTRDLASFWKTGYFEVRKDLRARYPKHAWPEDPLTAEPTRGVRRRR